MYLKVCEVLTAAGAPREKAQMSIAGLGRENRYAQSSLLQCRFPFDGSFLVDEGDFSLTAVLVRGVAIPHPIPTVMPRR